MLPLIQFFFLSYKKVKKIIVVFSKTLYPFCQLKLNFVVFAPIIMKFGTGIKLDVFYTKVIKTFVTSLL